MTQLEELREVVRLFVAERGWDQHHNPKNLSMALAVEAAEVLEHFQWCSEAESFRLAPEKREAVAHELSDVLMGVIRVADLLDIDLAAAFAEKMVQNRANRISDEIAVAMAEDRAESPPEKVRGRAIKYTEL